MALPLQPTKLRFTKAYLFGRNPLSGVGTVTSIDVSGGTSGLVFTGGPITTNGTITITSGLLDPAYGGTGVSNAFAAGILKVANGGTGLASVTAGLIPFGTGTTPLGTDSELQWDNANKRLGIGGVPTWHTHVQASVGSTGASFRNVDSTVTATGSDVNSRNAFVAETNATHTTGTCSTLSGLTSISNITGNGGTTTNLYGVSSSATVGAGATVTNRVALNINDANNTGIITNQYGILINNLTAGSVNWALYSTGTGLNSAHAGSLCVGNIIIPPAKLTVNQNTGQPQTPLSGTIVQINQADSQTARVEINAFGGAGFSPNLTMRAFGGTSASPSGTAANTEIARVCGAGRGTTANTTPKASHYMMAAENWTDAAQGTYQEWQTTATGSTTTAAKMHLSGTTFYVGNPPTTSPVLEASTTTGKLDGVVHIEAFGGKADALFNTGGNITSGSQALSLVGGGGSFSASDVGKTIMVAGAGAANGVLITTIAGYTSGTQVTLTASAGTTCVAGKVLWGTDNTTALASAVTQMGSNGKIQFRPGYYLLNGTTTMSVGHSVIAGAGPQSTIIYQISPTAETFKWGILEADQQIRDLSIEGPGPGFCSGSSSGISWAAGAGPYTNSWIHNVRIRDLNYGVYVPSAPANALELILDGVEIFSVNNTGVYSTGSESLNWSRGLIFNEYTPLTGLGITNGTTALSGTGFSSNWIGKRIVIQGAGAAGGPLQTTVVSVASTTALTVANAASTTVVAAAGVLGSNTQNGIYISGIGGYNLTNVDIVGCRYGMQLAPNAVACSYGWAYNLELDSSWDTGLYLNPTGGGTINSHVFTNCWFASTGLWAGTTYSGSGNQTGIYANGAANSVVQLSFNGCRIVNNGNHGANLSGLKQLLISGCIVDGNSNLATATYAGVRVDTASTVSIVGNTFGHQLFSTGTKDIYSIITTANVTGTLNISGNNYRDYNTVGTPVNNTSGLAGNALVNANNCYA